MKRNPHEMTYYGYGVVFVSQLKKVDIITAMKTILSISLFFKLFSTVEKLCKTVFTIFFNKIIDRQTFSLFINHSFLAGMEQTISNMIRAFHTYNQWTELSSHILHD